MSNTGEKAHHDAARLYDPQMLKSQKQKEKQGGGTYSWFLKIPVPSPTLLLGAGREKKEVSSYDLGAFTLEIPAAKGMGAPSDWSHSLQGIPARVYYTEVKNRGFFPPKIFTGFAPFQKKLVWFGLGFGGEVGVVGGGFVWFLFGFFF